MSDKVDKKKKKNAEASSSSSDDSSSVSSEEERNFSLKINEKFAESYNERKRRQELSIIESQKKEKMLRGLVDELDDDDDDSEEDESEDDVGEELDEETDLNIHKTIEMIRNRDAKIYDKNFVAFENKDDDSDDDDGSEGEKKSKKKKEILTYSKMMIDTMKKKGAEGLVKEEEDGDEDEDNNRRANSIKKLVYNKEQEDAKKKFKEELEKSMKEGIESEGDNEDQNDDGDDGDDEDLFLRKKEIKEPISEKEDKKKAKLKELVQTSKIDDDDEKFLQWYVLEQPWKQFKAPGYKEGMELYKPKIEEDDDKEEEGDKDEPEDEADLEELEKAEEFESKYNFRFEEEGGTHLVFHARNAIEGTMRRKDDSRKKKREQHKKAKEEEKRLKLEELKRLKNLKRKILEDRLKSASLVAGVDLSNVKKSKKDKKKKKSKHGEDGDEDEKPIGFTPEDLDEDFDPEKWDAKMNAIFNSEYYEEELDVDEKERVRPIHAESDSDEDSKASGDEVDEKEERGDGKEESNEDKESKKQKKKKKSKGEQINEIEEAAKTSDINVDDILKIEKEIEEGLNKLDFEGIAGGMPTRFKYVSVKPESYGLTTEEILETDNKLLNQLVSVKQLAPYRDRDFEVPAKRRNRFRKLVRQMQATGGFISEKFANKHGFTLKADKTPKEVLEKVGIKFGKKSEGDQEGNDKRHKKREREESKKSSSSEPKDKKRKNKYKDVSQKDELRLSSYEIP